MNDSNFYKLGLCFAVFSICVFIITGFFSLKAYYSSKDIEEQFSASVQDLQHNLVYLMQTS